MVQNQPSNVIDPVTLVPGKDNENSVTDDEQVLVNDDDSTDDLDDEDLDEDDFEVDGDDDDGDDEDADLVADANETATDDVLPGDDDIVEEDLDTDDFEDDDDEDEEDNIV